MIFNPNVMAAAGGGGGAVVGTYVGNAPEKQEGTFEQRIECNFTVGAVIFGELTNPTLSEEFDHAEVYTADMGNLTYISFDGTGFIVKGANSYSVRNKTWTYYGLNRPGIRYYYIAIQASS